MTTLTITPDVAKKKLKLAGVVASGEKVAVTVVGFGQASTENLRLRAMAGSVAVGVFPLEDEDEWTVSGADLTCTLNLATEQAERFCKLGSGVCFLLEDTSVPQLYGAGDFSLRPWIKLAGVDVPVNLDNYKVRISGLEGRLKNHIERTDNPHGVTKSQVGLGNVNNTSDMDKPVSTAQNAAIAALRTAMTEADDSLRRQIGEKYEKPSGGIPKTDLAQAVQTSLVNADSAVQPAALSAYVNAASYDSDDKKILLKNGTTTVAEIDATAFIKDGMVSSVAISSGNLVITFNTDAGVSPISIPLTNIFNPANYYDKTTANGRFAAKADIPYSLVEVEVDSVDNYNDRLSDRAMNHVTEARNGKNGIWTKGGEWIPANIDNIYFDGTQVVVMWLGQVPVLSETIQGAELMKDVPNGEYAFDGMYDISSGSVQITSVDSDNLTCVGSVGLYFGNGESVYLDDVQFTILQAGGIGECILDNPVYQGPGSSDVAKLYFSIRVEDPNELPQVGSTYDISPQQAGFQLLFTATKASGIALDPPAPLADGKARSFVVVADSTTANLALQITGAKGVYGDTFTLAQGRNVVIVDEPVAGDLRAIRLAGARTPTAHKSSHAKNGSDALTPGDIGAVAANAAITGSTKCKVTYDSKGLVTGGANLEASDIPTLSTEKLSDFGTKVRYGHYEHVYDSTGTVSLLDRTINDVTLQAVDLSEDWTWSDFGDEAHGQPVWNANAGEWELPSTSDLYGRLNLYIRDVTGIGKYSDGLEVSWTDANQAFTEIDLTYYGDSGMVGAVGPDGNQYGSDYASVDFSNGSIDATFTYGDPMRPIMVGIYAYYDSNDNGGVQHKITYSSSSQGTQYIRNASYDDVNNVVEFEFTRDQNWDHDEQAAAMVVGGDGSTYVEFTQPPGATGSNDLLFGRATLDNGSVSGVTLYVVEYATIYADIYHVEYVARSVLVDQTVASIGFPVLPSGTTGVRDFLMRLTVGDLSDLSYGYAPIAWPYDVVFETADGEMPDLSAQGTYLLSFMETKPASGNDPAVFALSCKELTEATQS